MDRKFIYKLGDKVISSNGLKGVISLVGFDRSGNIYFIKGKKHNDWFYEDELNFTYKDEINKRQ